MELSEITLYPIKSCGGLSVTSIRVDRFGPAGDRRWMVVKEDGGFLSQREHPQMSQVEVIPERGGIQLHAGGAAISVAVPAASVPTLPVRVWEDRVMAQDAGNEAAEWLGRQLGRSCRLVFMPEDTLRRVDGVYASEGETVSFADGFPLLLISQASLDELNSRLAAPVPMNRFRPNLVVTGCEPYAEDSWRRIRIGEMEFDVAKPCSRCVMPSINQETGERDPHINRVLAGFRRFNGQILFGQNLLYQQVGQLHTGDALVVLA